MTNLDKIIEYLHYHQGANRRELMDMLNLGVKDTQMKALLSEGIAKGDIRVEGKARATRYFITPKAQILRTVNLDSYYAVETDKREMQTAYNFELIRDILPKVELFTADEYKFLADRESAFLARMKDYPAEMYAKEMERLGIDLSWKSSEIEGNTYTLLETVNLLKDKIEAKGKKREEAIMLLNHKAARVGISGTRYRPLEVESQIREAVEDMCALVNGKSDPYEKALLALLLIAYIQPFTDGNKRTSRLMANSLLISRSLCPLSFRTVEANDYRAALLLFYEQNNISAFKKMFLEQVEFAMKEYF